MAAALSAALRKVIVRLLSQRLHRGYLPGSQLAVDGRAELLLPDGRALSLHMDEVKHVAYVRDFNLDDPNDPERMGFRSFASRPRGLGVWVRAHFADGDALEGLAPEGLPFLDALLLDHGISLEPPDKRGNTQRLFIPRSALSGFEILGIPGHAAVSHRRVPPAGQAQAGLFDANEERS